MKRIILALMLSVTVAGVAFANTRAVWTDNVTVLNNTITTGTVDLKVSTNNVPGPCTFSTASATSAMVLSNLVPGGPAQEGYSFSLLNNSAGVTTLRLSGQITTLSIVDDTPGVDRSKLEFQVYEMGGSNETGWVSLANWNTVAQNFTATIDSGVTRDYGIRARLDSSANNDWQGQAVTFTLSVTGSQP